MTTFIKSLGQSVLAMMVAIGAVSYSAAYAGSIRTPFAGMPKPVPGKAPVLQAGEVPSGFEPLWSVDITMADAEADCEDSQMRLLDDGGYIAVYTCGAGAEILEGRVVRLSAGGEKLWETVLQDGSNTTAGKVCQGDDGRFYVLGTTLHDGLSQSYLACVDADGKLSYLNVNEDDMATVIPVEVAAVGKQVAIVYTTASSAYGGTKTLTARWYDNDGSQMHVINQETSTTTVEYVSRLGDFLMVPMYSNVAYALDLKNAEISLKAEQERGAVYFNGCASGDALYTLHKNASSMLVLTQYKIENGSLVEKWNCLTRQENTGYDSFSYPINDGKVLIYNKLRQSGPGIAIINPDGSKAQDKKVVNFGEFNSAWAYAASQVPDGTIYIFGMYAEGMTYGLSVLTTDDSLNNPQAMLFDNLDPDFTLFYSQYGHSYYADGQFVFSGYMRPEDYNAHGYTPIFGAYTIADNDMKILYTGTPGNIAKIEGGEISVDENHNVYATMTSNSKSVLAKYDADGNQQWVRYLGSNGKLFKPVILSNGNICTGTYSDGIKVVCYSPDGEVVYDVTDKSVLDNLSYIRSAFAVESDDNSLIVACSGYNPTTFLGMPYVTKVDARGSITSKLIDNYAFSTYVEGITGDADGNAYILGNTSNVDDINLPVIIKVDSNLDVKKAFTQDIDVHCPLYYGAVDADGRIFVVGNTWYHGMLFVYDKDFNLLGYHIFEDSTYTKSEYESLSVSPEGDVLVSANYQDEDNSRYGLVICYNDRAELQWKFGRTTEDSGYYNLYNAARNGDEVIAVGLRNSAVGVQNYAMVLNADREIVKEYYVPQDKGYGGYAFGSYEIVGGCAYIECSYKSGKAMFGNLTCFGDRTSVSVDGLIVNAGADGIVFDNDTATLASGESALWEVYTTAGGIVTKHIEESLDLNTIGCGIYIISAKNANDVHTIKIAK